MDLRRGFLFPVIIWVVIQRDFILGGQAGINDGPLILTSNDSLKIDTTAPCIVKGNGDRCNINASRETENDTCVAYVTFSGDIQFQRGSRINVTGDCALSITSQNGNITIKADINMTCDNDVFDTTCLGGFTQSSQPETSSVSEKVYKGMGPGVLQEFNPPLICIFGSAHGGKALKSQEPDNMGGAYDKENLKTFRGGSGGSCKGSRKGVAGGGAIELVSKTGFITIDASIRASAQSTSSDASCSGGSGGLIRLKAQQVEILNNGELIVDGGDGKAGSGATTQFGGGAGGVIQIISAMGNLSAHSLSLKGGSGAIGCNIGKKPTAANGYYYVQACNVTGHDEAFLGQSFSWYTKPHFKVTTSPTTSQQTTTSIITTSPASRQQTTPSSPKGIDERVNKLMNHSEHLRISLEKNGEWNKSAFREVISVHKNLTSSFVLSQKTVQPLCLEMFNIYGAIMNDIAERDPEFLKEALQGILEIVSNCTEEKNHPVWKETRRLPELMQTLEDTLVSSIQGNGSTEVNRVIVSSNAVAQVVRESSNASMTDITIPNISVVGGDPWKSVVDSLVIPRLTVMEAKGNYTYVFVLFKDVANALPSNTAKKRERISSADWEVSSLLMSCFLMLDDVPVKDLSPPANLIFNTSVAQTFDKQCSFWNNNKSYWSAEGIKQIPSANSELTICETNHFTSFAVLIKHRATELSHRDKLALSIITYVGCGVSTVALSITLIVFLSIESLSADRHKIHMNLVLSLLLAQVLFLAGIGETSNQVICKIIAVFMHYFYLTAFTWMLVEGLHLYLKVVQVFKTENVKILYYYIFGWGFAIIPVGITTALKPNKYGNSDICWLSLEDGTVWAFIGPVIAIIAVNGIVLLMVIKTVVTSAASIKSSEYDHIKAGIKGLFVLMPILGVGWILGLFAINKATIVFEYAFAIVNGLQGLFIFLLHCAFNNEVRNAFRRQREKNALSKENDSQYQPTSSLSHSFESSGKEKRFSFNSQEKIKAPLSFKKKTTTRVVQVEPMRDRPDIIDTLKVNRTFETGHSNKLAVTDEESEISSLHCPSLEDEERAPPKTFHLVNQRTSTQKKQNRP